MPSDKEQSDRPKSGKFHYNPGNQAGKPIGNEKEAPENNDRREGSRATGKEKKMGNKAKTDE